MSVLKQSGELERETPLIWDFHNYGGIVAIRDGRWKALRRNVLRKTPGVWELYDLENDEAETTDLASKAS